MRPPEDLDQGTFARTILTEQGQHLTPLQQEIHTLQGKHSGKGLVDAPHLKERSVWWGARSIHFAALPEIYLRPESFSGCAFL
jgi:hypothetical protein